MGPDSNQREFYNSNHDDVASLAGNYYSFFIWASQFSSTTRNLVPRFNGWSKGKRLGKDGAQHKIGTWGLSHERGIEAYLDLNFNKVIESKARRCNKKLQADGQLFDV